MAKLSPTMLATLGKIFLRATQFASWEAKAVANVAASPKLLAKGRFRFPNFTRRNITDQLREKESRGGAFSQMAFISFLFALRAPSDALPISRAYRNDDLV